MSTFGLCALSGAQTYTHKLLGAHGYVFGGGINDAGDYWYTAQEDPDATNYEATSDLYVNGANFSSQVFGGDWHRVYRPYVSEKGSVLWLASSGEPHAARIHMFADREDYSGPTYGDAANCGESVYNQSGHFALGVSQSPGTQYPFDTWIRDRNISEEVLGPNRGWSQPTYLAADGTLFWSGANSFTGPNGALFRDTVNLTTSLLGSGGNDGPYAFSGAPSGAFAWSGAGPNTGTKRHVFNGTNDLSYQVFHDLTHRADLSAVNNVGQVAWWGGHPGAHDSDFYRDTENMSSFLGPNRRIGQFGLIDDLGNVYWFGQPNGLAEPGDIYRNRENLTTPILGDANRNMYLWEVSPSGHLLWSGLGAPTGYREDIFVDSFNITRDALGPSTVFILWDMHVNSSGSVIWTITRNGKREAWLSTPVAEPQVVGGLLLFVGVAIARFSRCETYKRSKPHRAL